MALIYIAGIVSGVLLVSIALFGWIRSASRQLSGDHVPQTRQQSKTNSNSAPVARDIPNGGYRDTGTTPAFA